MKHHNGHGSRCVLIMNELLGIACHEYLSLRSECKYSYDYEHSKQVRQLAGVLAWNKATTRV